MISQRYAAFLQPGIECSEAGEGRRVVPQPVPGILHVLLDLPLLPARSRIAELGLEQVVAHHRRKAHVDIARLAHPDPVHRRLHVVVDAAARHPAQ